MSRLHYQDDPVWRGIDSADDGALKRATHRTWLSGRESEVNASSASTRGGVDVWSTMLDRAIDTQNRALKAAMEADDLPALRRFGACGAIRSLSLTSPESIKVVDDLLRDVSSCGESHPLVGRLRILQEDLRMLQMDW